MTRRLIPVSTLVAYLKQTIEDNRVLHGVLVEGEISNLRQPYSGHWYFSLKDERASLPCVMFAGANRYVNFPVKNGTKVIVTGDVTVYEAEGRMQLRILTMRPSGIGELYLQLEERKKKLSAEGLFAEDHKKPLPKYPMRIGLVTGNNTAAREDVLRTLRGRWPIAQLREYPAPVQGEGAAVKIIEALRTADRSDNEVILLVRGGGSLEDLWCFNDETLARFIYAMKTPVVTGVGHETDTTLVDYVADVRANTPTGAVEAAVPDYHDVDDSIEKSMIRMYNACRQRIRILTTRYGMLMNRPVFKNPASLYEQKSMQLDAMEEKLTHSTLQKIQTSSAALDEDMKSLSTAIHTASNRMRTHLTDSETQMRVGLQKKTMAEQSRIAERKTALINAVKTAEEDQIHTLGREIALLDAYSPLKVMARGYSIVIKNGCTVNDVSQLNQGDTVSIHMYHGSAQAEITGTEGEKSNERKEENI